MVEVWHGTHDYVPKINSWKPKGDAWLQAVKEHFGRVWTGKQEGRRDNMRIYTIEFADQPEKAPYKTPQVKEVKKAPPEKKPAPAPKVVPDSKDPAKTSPGSNKDLVAFGGSQPKAVKEEDKALVEKITKAPSKPLEPPPTKPKVPPPAPKADEPPAQGEAAPPKLARPVSTTARKSSKKKKSSKKTTDS